MKYYATILGTHTHDVHPSVILHLDSGRYLFNCGEGTQRIAVETSMKLSRIRNVLLTRTSWDCIGGLPGMLLTLADQDVTGINIHGPPMLRQFMKGIQYFTYRPNLRITLDETRDAQETVKDENVTIVSVLIRPTLKDAAASWNGDTPMEPADQDEESRQKRHAGVISTCYVCTGPVQPGKFNPAAAQKLGIKPGPKFGMEPAAFVFFLRRGRIFMYPGLGLLTKGESVEANDGTLIHPHQCVGPETPGAVFFILDCPSELYISSLINAPYLQQFKNVKTSPVTCIIHILGDGVLENVQYREWIRSFGNQTQHIIMSEKHNPQTVIFRAVGRIQQQLNYIDKEIFPVQYTNDASIVDLQKDLKLPKNSCLAKPLLTIQFAPTFKLDESACRGPLDIEPPAVTLQPHLAKVYRDRNALVDSLPHENEDDAVQIIPLGTGSALPSKYRNVSSTFVQLPTGNIFLDGGEGTYGQLFRAFGQQTADVMRNLKIIFISHMHADHHLGVFMLIARWNEYTKKEPSRKLYLVGPVAFESWMSSYSQCEDIGWDRIVFIRSDALAWDRHTPERFRASVQQMQASVNLTSFQTVKVDHCPDAYAVVFTEGEENKIVFSGDCRPCDDLVTVGQGAAILIHEATLENDMYLDALDKKHSTTGEALDVAKRMLASRVLLTHFSQRYPKLPVLTPAVTKKAPRTSPSPDRSRSTSPSAPGKAKRQRSRSNSSDGDVVPPIVGIAFDLMRVTKRNFALLPSLTPALASLFLEEDGVENDRDSIVSKK
ncbi:hypothetical protein SmJEL517_g05361 [Synchytrium microbalum]|uniref:ribonuclease Z n=1 Tax=Synchytrium microbalum TaxID=1806994 RepID=A0A507BUJ5_9FUNG|nr:uncharacterized protein SmJEL517_g05361 [Synchytrium microbalum]TPX31232.1 hypothetical protein SmJEL517_g05361 [Synchytrium microbalum]